MAELGYFEIDCKKLHFEKNDFEIYEPDFWEKINFETFYAQNYSQKLCSTSILNSPIRFWGLFYMKNAPSYTLTSFYGYNAFGSHSKTKKVSIRQLLYFGDMFLKGISLDFCKNPRTVHFDLNCFFRFPLKLVLPTYGPFFWRAEKVFVFFFFFLLWQLKSDKQFF